MSAPTGLAYSHLHVPLTSSQVIAFPLASVPVVPCSALLQYSPRR